MIYLMMFLVSLALLYFGSKQKKAFLKIVFIGLGIMLPCILAGLRDVSVGTDTGGYVLNYYNVAGSTDSFAEFVDIINMQYGSRDLLFLLLSYIFGKLGLSFHVLLFVQECLVVFPIFFALKNLKFKDSNIIFGMLFFYLSFYNLSLNMVRQSIAISLSLLGFSFLVEKKEMLRMKYFLPATILLIAIGFHDSAVIALPIYILYELGMSGSFSRKTKNLGGIVIVFASIIFLAMYRQILLFVGANGIYPKALLYLDNYSVFDINYLGTALNIGILLMVILNKKVLRKKKGEYGFLTLLAIENIIVGFLSTFIMYAGRVSYYALFLLVICYMPLLDGYDFTRKGDGENKNRKLAFVVFCAFLTAYWMVITVINNSNSTVPYVLGV